MKTFGVENWYASEEEMLQRMLAEVPRAVLPHSPWLVRMQGLSSTTVERER